MFTVYLEKASQPVRITSLQFDGYKRAKREGMGANVGCNPLAFGISALEYTWIREAVRSTCGICEEMATVGLINEWFVAAPYLVDKQGRYLNFFGKPVPVERY